MTLDIFTCEVCGYQNPTDHYFCGRCGQRLEGRPQIFVEQAAVEGERRPVTVMFADMSGFTALNDAAKTPAEVERVVGLVNSLLQDLSEAIYEFDGYIDKYIGDEIMAIFGAPKSHENDPELALRAALSMMARLERFNDNPPFPLAKPLGMHFGINTGMVIAGMVGSERKRSYTVMGDVVNVAARLEGVSVRGEIFVSETTYNLTKRLFNFDKRDPVSVKGKPKPISVYQLKSVREHPIKGTDREAPLIGRDQDMAALTAMYQQLRQGQGGIVVVEGDAGTGKSRLIEELQNEVFIPSEERAPLWLFGRGLSYRRSLANRLFVDILRGYLDLASNADDTLVRMRLHAMGQELLGTRHHEVIPYLETMMGLSLDPDVAERLPLNDPQALQLRTFTAIGEWVEAMVAQQPVILVFEDLHWSDPDSVSLLEYLMTLTLFNPLLLICATRIERDTPFWELKKTVSKEYANYTGLMLWPLTDSECRGMIKGLLGAGAEHLRSDVERLMLSRAEGNPLFLEEVVRSLVEEEIIKRVDGAWQVLHETSEINIPRTLQGVFTARIDRLQDRVKRVLQVAAVIGRVFPKFVLTPIVGNEEMVEAALPELEAAELIEVQGDDNEPEYVFKHVLIHETAYNSLLMQQRQAIHKQIADYMSRLYWQLGEKFAADVAEHYYQAEVWSRCYRYLRRAAEAASQSLFNREAVQFYDRALQVTELMAQEGEQVDRRGLLEIYQSRAKLLARLGEPQNAIRDYEQVIALAQELDQDTAQLRALNGLGGLQESHYELSAAAELFEEALAVARRIGDANGIAETLNQLGNFRFTMGQMPEAEQYYHEALRISREAQAEISRIEAEDGLTALSVEQGHLLSSIARYQEIISVRQRLGYRSGLLRSLVNLLKAQIYRADYAGVEDTVAEIESLYKSGDLYLAPLVRYWYALSLLHRGNPRQAYDTLQDGLDLAEKYQQRSWIILGWMWLGYFHLNLGAVEDAFEPLEKAYELAMEQASPLYVLRTRTMMATGYRHNGNYEAAVENLENLYVVAQKMNLIIDQTIITYQLARTYLSLENWERLETSTAALLMLAEQHGLREYVIRGLWLKSVLLMRDNETDQALTAIQQALGLAEEVNNLSSQYYLHIEQAKLYQRQGDASATQQSVSRAQELQKQLLANFANEAWQQSFLSQPHVARLQQLAD